MWTSLEAACELTMRTSRETVAEPDKTQVNEDWCITRFVVILIMAVVVMGTSWFRGIRAIPSAKNGDDHSAQSFKSSRLQDTEDQELELYAKAAAEFKVSWQKHKQERENKVLQAVRTELNGYLSGKRAAMEEVTVKIEQAYQNYLAQTTVMEDKIRAVMVAIVEKQQKLLSLAVQKHQKVIEVGQDVEAAQTEALRHSQDCV
ncbi:hypothetical protein F5J12DRAFT_785980 [Pisolithus orientalis]|uniref:uncharacterized protein n=1 Tax=Pisolithus orientalis TaxID=936130 RepID=UPI002224DD13|nr:uncharacterized protein F5J12DRAFT_785980 [Pisolithus orientalis]KAI5993735.1 hypothetical protein F5J12DRAFT_785980 [Pisolithus orientalis]